MNGRNKRYFILVGFGFLFALVFYFAQRTVAVNIADGSLRALYHFNGTSTDSSIYGHNPVGGDLPTSFPEGKLNLAASLDGSSQFIVLPTSTLATAGSAWSFGAWYNAASDESALTIMGWYDSASDSGLALSYNTQVGNKWAITNLYQSGNPSASYTYTLDTQWHLVAGRCDSGLMELFFDGNIVASSSTNCAWGSNVRKPNIGAHNNSGSTTSYLKGAIDEFFFMDRKITNSELASLWNSGNGEPISPNIGSATITMNAPNNTLYSNSTNIQFRGTITNTVPVSLTLWSQNLSTYSITEVPLATLNYPATNQTFSVYKDGWEYNTDYKYRIYAYNSNNEEVGVSNDYYFAIQLGDYTPTEFSPTPLATPYAGTPVPSPYTTSTSGILESSFSCGDGFIGILCNFAAWLIVPSDDSINQWQNIRPTMQEKVPTSYYYDIKKKVDVLSYTATSTFPTISMPLQIGGTTTTLTLFSSSTLAAAIPQPQRSLLRSIIELALYVSFATYILDRVLGTGPNDLKLPPFTG